MLFSDDHRRFVVCPLHLSTHHALATSDALAPRTDNLCGQFSMENGLNMGDKKNMEDGLRMWDLTKLLDFMQHFIDTC